MRYAASFLYGCAVSVLTGVALAWANTGLTRSSSIVALCAGTLAMLVGCLHASRTRPKNERPRGWEWFPIALFALFAARAFLWLIFREGDDLCVLSPNNLGDISLHLTYIEYFANGAPFWPNNPIFASGKLAYAAGVDLFNSILVLAGLDTVRGLLWVGLCGAILSGLALWQWGRGFALLGFLCVGGLLGWTAFAQPAGEPFFQDYPGILKYDWAWKSPPLALFVTQRGFLYALPAGLFLLSSWRARYLRGGNAWCLPLAGEVLLYAAMPVFHLHTFLALSFVLLCWFLCRREERHRIAAFVGASFIPATILVYLTVGMLHSSPPPEQSATSQVNGFSQPQAGRVLSWKPGWMVNEPLEKFDPWAKFVRRHPEVAPWEAHGRFLIFWIGNFGFLSFLVLWAAWHLLRRVSQRSISALWPWIAGFAFAAIAPLCGATPLPLISATAAFFVLLFVMARRWEPDFTAAASFFPGIFLFFVCCNVMFAPHAWDNTKLMIWAILLVLPALWELMRTHWPRWVRAMVLVILFFPGAVILLGGLGAAYHGYPIGQLSELEELRKATRSIPITETFAADPTYNHPLLLIGRKLALGYPAHLWSHGLVYEEQEAHLDALMRGGSNWRSHAESLSARYLFFGRRESLHWPNSLQPWRNEARIVAQGADWTLYELAAARN